MRNAIVNVLLASVTARPKAAEQWHISCAANAEKKRHTTVAVRCHPDLACFGYTQTGVGASGPPTAYIWLQPK